MKPSQVKSFKVTVKGYLRKIEKPALIRVWLSANYKDTDDKLIKRVTTEFLDKGNLIMGKDLTGIVNDELKISVVIPKIENWLLYAKKAKIHVGLIKSNVLKPMHITTQNTAAVDYRELGYRN